MMLEAAMPAAAALAAAFPIPVNYESRALPAGRLEAPSVSAPFTQPVSHRSMDLTHLRAFQDLYQGMVTSSSAPRAIHITFSQSETPARDVQTIRRMTGLPWDRISDMFGVSRKSIHNWASGAIVKPENAQRISEVVKTLRDVDRGMARANASLLEGELSRGKTGIELLRDGEYDEVRRSISEGAKPKDAPRAQQKAGKPTYAGPRFVEGAATEFVEAEEPIRQVQTRTLRRAKARSRTS